jgi:hypothetical protein
MRCKPFLDDTCRFHGLELVLELYRLLDVGVFFKLTMMSWHHTLGETSAHQRSVLGLNLMGSTTDAGS